MPGCFSCSIITVKINVLSWNSATLPSPINQCKLCKNFLFADYSRLIDSDIIEVSLLKEDSSISK
jgi:hypothetical protein